MFDSRRILPLNDVPYSGGDILYWTEGALRVEWNCSLAYASEYAQDKHVSLLPLITIDSHYQYDNIRQLVFLVQSIQALQKSYKEQELVLSVAYGTTQKILEEVVEKNAIGMIIASASYVRYFRDILDYLAQKYEIPVILIDDASLVPPWIVSDHEEYGAYTLRKKYWNTVAMLRPESDIHPIQVQCVQTHDDLDHVMQSAWYQKYEKDLIQVSQGHENMFQGGEDVAQQKWNTFIHEKLGYYDTSRNDPNKDNTSLLSPYFHFGCISPLQIFHELRLLREDPNTLAFLEECLVRRELAINMWYYQKHSDKWDCLPNWVIKTLDEDREKNSQKKSEYSLEVLRHGKTDDPLWNAAQKELIQTGKIHGYVRMYWGKQLLRWFDDWKKAYGMATHLNDTYAVDGCSPNGYTGIAWCFGKHDRPFPPKKTHYGLVRSMTSGGMKKKFDTEAYIKKWG